MVDLKQQSVELVAKVWRVQVSRRLTESEARVHWAYARGPLSACTCVLKDLGLKCSELLVWESPDGQIGLAEGCDLAVAKRHLSSLLKGQQLKQHAL